MIKDLISHAICTFRIELFLEPSSGLIVGNNDGFILDFLRSSGNLGLRWLDRDVELEMSHIFTTYFSSLCYSLIRK